MDEPGDAALVSAAVERAHLSIRNIGAALEAFDSLTATASDWQELSAQVGVELAVFRAASGEVNRLLGLSSAQARLLSYLRAHVGSVVPGDALAGVAAVSAWARRVRELRVEHGWPIETGVQRPDLSSDEYILTADAPNKALAAAWNTANEIRKRQGAGKTRLLALLQALSPRSVDQDQLTYVAKIKSWQRRVRELDEEGWEIRSNVDEPDLAPGTYRLATLDRRPPRARQAIALRYSILERDGFTCQDCSAKRGEPGIRLEVHHRVWVSNLGGNEPDNLVTLCDGCHAGRHSVERGRTDDELRRPGIEHDYL